MYDRRIVGEGSKIRQKSEAKQSRGKNIEKKYGIPIGKYTA